MTILWQPPPAEPLEVGSGWGDADALLAMQPHGESGASVAVHYVAMWRRFAEAQVESMQGLLAWGSLDFSVRNIDINQVRPSERLQRLFAQAGALGDAASDHLGTVAARELILEVLEGVISRDILCEDFWERLSPHRIPPPCPL